MSITSKIHTLKACPGGLFGVERLNGNVCCLRQITGALKKTERQSDAERLMPELVTRD